MQTKFLSLTAFISGEKRKEKKPRNVQWHAEMACSNRKTQPPPPPIKQRRWNGVILYPFSSGGMNTRVNETCHGLPAARSQLPFAGTQILFVSNVQRVNDVSHAWHKRHPLLPIPLVSLTFASLPRTNGSRRGNSGREIATSPSRERERKR